MPDLYSSLNRRTKLQSGDPKAGWIYPAQNLKFYRAAATRWPTTADERKTLPKRFLQAVNPEWWCILSRQPFIYMLVDTNRYNNLWLEEVLNSEVYCSTPGDTIWTVDESTGSWNADAFNVTGAHSSSGVWDTGGYRKIDPVYTFFTPARFTNSQTDGLLTSVELGDSIDSVKIFHPLSKTQSISNSLVEYQRAFQGGQNYVLDFRNGGKNFNFYPYDLAMSNTNVALVGISFTTLTSANVNETGDTFYDINNIYENLVGDFNPLAYTWLSDKDDVTLMTTCHIIMFVDISRFDIVAWAERVSGIGGLNDEYISIFVSAPDSEFVPQAVSSSIPAPSVVNANSVPNWGINTGSGFDFGPIVIPTPTPPPTPTPTPNTTATYTVTSSSATANEGDTVIFSVTTTNVPNGTQIPFSIQGIQSADLSTGLLSGNLTINNNVATYGVTLRNDTLTEGTETMRFILSGGRGNTSVTISDTSTTAPSGGGGGGSGGGSSGITQPTTGTFISLSDANYLSTNSSPVVGTRTLSAVNTPTTNTGITILPGYGISVADGTLVEYNIRTLTGMTKDVDFEITGTNNGTDYWVGTNSGYVSFRSNTAFLRITALRAGVSGFIQIVFNPPADPNNTFVFSVTVST